MKILTGEDISSKLPKRPNRANKGTFGKVLVIAGSENFPGAAYLSCAACYRVGAGLVSLVTDETTKIITSRKLPEVTFISSNQVIEKINEYDVILLGPGLGQEKETCNFVENLLMKKLPKTVVDGDGLNILSKTNSWWDKFKIDAVLTPHPKEMERLTGCSVDYIQNNREAVALEFAKKWNQIIVLKGANTIVVSPAGETRVSPFANPALATAGTGDILAGVISGLVAQGLDLFEAAYVGVYLHGLTGEKVRQQLGSTGVIASDLLPFLPKTIKELSSR